MFASKNSSPLSFITTFLLNCCALISTAQYCDPQYALQKNRYDSLYSARDFYGAMLAGEKALRHCLNCNNPEDHYAIAAAAALAGEKDLAFRQLNIATEKGYARIDHLAQDPDFRTLASDDRWNDMLRKISENAVLLQEAYMPELAAELEEILRLDQSVRQEETSDSLSDERLRQMMMTDSINLVKVIRILDEHGWPGPEQVGREGNQAVFLVIQHADRSTQEKYLPVMREAVKYGQAEFSELAMLEDRVLMNQGKKQIYGSQIGFNEETGNLYVVPVEDPDHLDERRACAGMVPMAEYLNYFGLTWNPEEYKRSLPALEEYHRSRY
jgi:hypothetical protein